MLTRYVLTLALALAAIPAAHAQPFITTWQTIAANGTITIPTFPGETYNYSVDWGDGSTDTGVTGDITHTYAAPGIHTVEITGVFPHIYFNNTGDKDKILSVEQWGNIAWGNMLNAFMGASNLVLNATDAPDLSAVDNLWQTFWGATSLTGDLNNWDVSTIVAMLGTFLAATTFNGDISSWDVSNVQNMTGMFWDASSFNQDISTWDVSNVTSMGGMFYGATVFNQNIGGWNVSQVTNMDKMFAYADAFNQDISGWDVSNVSDMDYMFASLPASAFNQNIGGWDVSGATTMAGMFQGATMFNQDIGGWDVANVTNTTSMFSGASAFNQDLGGWDIGNVTDMTSMLDNSGLSTANYDAALIGWAGQNVQPGVPLGALNMTWCIGTEARHVLLFAPNNWSITGDSGGAPCFPSDPADVAGWRMLTVPGSGLTVQDLADRNLVQGVAGSYPNAAPNLYVRYDGPTNANYQPAGTISDALQPGRGFFWYLYDDADFGSFVPPEFVDIEIFALPHDLGVQQQANVTVVFQAVPQTTGNDLPAYMIGNPFQDPFQLAGVSANTGTLQTNFFAWDPNAQPASYVTLGTSDYTRPWQGFWAEVDGTNPVNFTLDINSVDPNQNPPFIGLRASESFAVDLSLRGTSETGRVVGDLANRIRFEPDAMAAWDRHDGSKFLPPISIEGYALLSLEGTRKGAPYRQAVRSLPADLDHPVTIPMALLVGEEGAFELAATPSGLPDGWSLTLRDLATNEETDLLDGAYAFTSSGLEGWQDRFLVTITPAGVVGSGEDATQLRLSNPTPNPATTSTALVLQVPEAQRVAARVYDALGRRVATAFNGTLDAGEETRLEIDTSALAAGAYVVRVKGEGFAETRRFTVVR